MLFGTHLVGTSVFLLRPDDGATSLSGIQSTASSDNSLSTPRASSSLAPDLGDSVPVFRHIVEV
jgi:hypothetical protein